MNKYIAVYLRLSEDDGNTGESNSIAGQRQIIENYIFATSSLSGLPIKEFVDDGYSGTNFNRPAVKLLLDAVLGGEIKCIIVKDLSRFGRQYLEVSKFIEQLFPHIGIRFIAVNDRYDSNNHKGTTADIDVPIRNMINALYSKDISKKIISAKRTQLKQGVFSNAFAPYGYKKSKADKHVLLVDEPAAEVVKRIFELSVKGYSAYQIAGRLNTEGVLPPASYKKQNGSSLACNDMSRGIWTNGIISRILRDERYTGTLVGGKHETIAVGSGKKRHTSKESWVRVQGVLPVIIDPEVFNALAAKRQRAAVFTKPRSDRVLYKKVRCGFCNHLMRYTGDAAKPYYLCDTARYTDRYGCGRGKYSEGEIIDKVRIAIQAQITILLDLQRLCNNKKKVLRDENQATYTALKNLDTEIKQLQAYKLRLYERYKNGALNKGEFSTARKAAESDIKAKSEERDRQLTENNKQSDELSPVQRFLSAFEACQGMTEFPNGIITELVETVYMHGKERIEIRLSFRKEPELDLKAFQDIERAEIR